MVVKVNKIKYVLAESTVEAIIHCLNNLDNYLIADYLKPKGQRDSEKAKILNLKRVLLGTSHTSKREIIEHLTIFGKIWL